MSPSSANQLITGQVRTATRSKIGLVQVLNGFRWTGVVQRGTLVV